MPTFAQQKNAIDPKIEQQIRVLAAKYDAAFNKHDSAAVAAFFTEDAVLGTPHGTFHGRQAIEKDWRNTISRATIPVTFSLQSIG